MSSTGSKYRESPDQKGSRSHRDRGTVGKALRIIYLHSITTVLTRAITIRFNSLIKGITKHDRLLTARDRQRVSISHEQYNYYKEKCKTKKDIILSKRGLKWEMVKELRDRERVG